MQDINIFYAEWIKEIESLPGGIDQWMIDQKKIYRINFLNWINSDQNDSWSVKCKRYWLDKLGGLAAVW